MAEYGPSGSCCRLVGFECPNGEWNRVCRVAGLASKIHALHAAGNGPAGGVGTATARLQVTPPLMPALVDQTSDSTRLAQQMGNHAVSVGEGQAAFFISSTNPPPPTPPAWSHPPTFFLPSTSNFDLRQPRCAVFAPEATLLPSNPGLLLH